MQVRRKKKQKGFTLMEILVVMVILATLAALGLGLFTDVLGSSNEKETTLRINAVATAMEKRQTDITTDQKGLLSMAATDAFPSGDGGPNSSEIIVRYLSGDFDGNGDVDDNVTPTMTQVIANNKGSSDSYVNSDGLLVDAWGSEIRYQFPGVYQNGVDGFDLISPGPDKDYTTEEDNILLK